MKRKLLIIVPVLVLLAAGAGTYKFMFAKEAAPEHKVQGTVYVLGKEFLVNLADARYAKLTVGLLLDPHDTSATPAEAGGHGAAPAPPEGFGPMPQEALVRNIVVEQLTGASDQDLIDPRQREQIKNRVLRAIKRNTDVHAEEVLFTDLTVQ